MVLLLNPLDILLWSFRRSGRDVVKLYDALSPVMQLATDGNMLNFGYWTQEISEPVLAQKNLCKFVGDLAGLDSAEKVLDVGSGLAAPAIYWETKHPQLDMCCVNINFNQLKASIPPVSSVTSYDKQSAAFEQRTPGISMINATSTILPVTNASVDRIIALESAQHFRPFADFARESARALRPGGLLLVAIPIVSLSKSTSFFSLGILSMTWSSEHYTFDQIQSAITQSGLTITFESRIGSLVYEPLADYYVQNREKLRHQILKMYPSYVEKILHRSILKMRTLSRKGTIDYVIIRAAKKL